MSRTDSSSLQQLSIAGQFTALALGSLSYWAGKPAHVSVGEFLLGIAVVITIALGFGVLAWHLLWRPLPDGHTPPALNTNLSAAARQLLAILMAIAALNVVVGGFWDELWHRKYGLPFGEDLFWRPHIMLYVGFGLIALLGFGSLGYIVLSGSGTLQQRFRRDPTIGMLAILGGFLVYALPSDPLWHLVYGEDITAWSLPHLVLLVMVLVICLLSIAIFMTTLPSKAWGTVQQLTLPLFSVITIASFGLVVYLQVLTTEWDLVETGIMELEAWVRPDSLLPIIIIAHAAFFGTLINTVTRCIGSATVMGIASLIIRSLLLGLFGDTLLTANGWIAILPLLLALDVCWWLCYRGHVPLSWVSSGLAVVAGFVGVTGWFFNQLYPRPQLTWMLLSVVVVIGIPVALSASWLGMLAGSFLGNANKPLTLDDAPTRQLQFVAPVSFLAMLGFIVWFIVTASPPV